MKKRLNIIDLTLPSNINTDISNREFFLMLFISMSFSTPTKFGEHDYIVSQYIAEFIKSLDYDGVKFRSSLCNNGINITIYDKQNCTFMKSEVYRVDCIDISSTKILPLDL